MTTATLYRLDETLWSFQRGDREIRILTPGFSDRVSDYRLAKKAKEVLEAQPNARGFEYLATERPAPDLLGKWQIVDRTQDEYKNLQKGSLIYTRQFTNLNVRVFKIEPDSYSQSLSLTLKKSLPWGKPDLAPTKKWELPFQEGANLFFQSGAFSDPFTKLATRAFQKYETPFVSEHESKGSHHFTLENGKLLLQRTSSSPEGKAAAVSAFRDFMKQSYEWRMVRGEELDQDLQNYERASDQFLGYLKSTFGIDFDAMLKEKKPLLPDHVYKCCIAANQIEIAMVESFYLRLEHCLKAKLQDVREQKEFQTAGEFYDFLKGQQLNRFFSFREIDGIYQSFVKHAPSKSLSSLKQYLDGIFCFPSSNKFTIRSLTPQSLDRLMNILFIGWAAPKPEPFFTGRKILHLAISGYKTMGNKDIYDPCRNVAELLHIFPHLKKENLLSYNELLTHVAVKKGLHQCYPSSKAAGELEGRAGRLLPFADLWYYVESYLNDGAGDVNYVFLPASKGYLEKGSTENRDEIASEKKLPLIKLYRSTASDKEAESSLDSLLADLNPKGIGSLHFTKGDNYEQPYFQRCTMPVWVAYLSIGDVKKAVESFRTLDRLAIKNSEKKEANGKEENLLRFLLWQRQDPSLDMAKIYQAFKKQIGEKELDAFFKNTSFGEEWAKYNKVAQDIHFMGHSLGAALSQGGFYHFGPREGRVPLANCHFKCFAYDPPGGVTTKQNQQFLAFGREHKALLQKLGQKWEIYYQFEYQDLVPQGGAEWLGVAKDSDLDSDWLEVRGVLFKPKSTANDPAIVTMPTHGRRFNHIPSELASQEYEAIPISKKELYTFKTSYLFPSELREKFGFNVTVPRATEGLRGTAGVAAFSLLWLKKSWDDMWTGNKNGNKDSEGVRFYEANRASPLKEEEN